MSLRYTKFGRDRLSVAGNWIIAWTIFIVAAIFVLGGLAWVAQSAFDLFVWPWAMAHGLVLEAANQKTSGVFVTAITLVIGVPIVIQLCMATDDYVPYFEEYKTRL